jgi:3-methyl-2-oxobutanoate hydroxymethyltransferase
MLGFFDRFTPKFVKKYANFNATLSEVFSQYKQEVESKAFPAKEHCYGMPADEMEKLNQLLGR